MADQAIKIPDEITNSEDTIDTRNVIERIEYLKKDIAENYNTDDGMDAKLKEEAEEELKGLELLIQELRDSGGEDPEDGITLIRDNYFEDYAQDFAWEMGDNPGWHGSEPSRWPYTCIDWEKAAEELQMDYSEIDFGGIVYWYR